MELILFPWLNQFDVTQRAHQNGSLDTFWPRPCAHWRLFYVTGGIQMGFHLFSRFFFFLSASFYKKCFHGLTSSVSAQHIQSSATHPSCLNVELSLSHSLFSTHTIPLLGASCVTAKKRFSDKNTRKFESTPREQLKPQWTKAEWLAPDNFLISSRPLPVDFSWLPSTPGQCVSAPEYIHPVWWFFSVIQ